MRDSGVAIMGTGIASGEDRALKAVELALASPLLNDNNIHGASDILLFMASGSKEMEMDEVATITDYIQDEAGLTAEIIWGNGNEESLDEGIRVTVVATGFARNSQVENSAKTEAAREPKKVVHNLDDEINIEKNQPKNEVEDDGMRLITREPKPAEPIANVSPSKPEYHEAAHSAEVENITIYTLDGDEPEIVSKNAHDLSRKKMEEAAPEINEEFQAKANERISKLRNLSQRFSTSEDLAELENTPAYIRRGVALSDTPSSKEENISRYTLDAETGDVKSNNSFLHDNVD